MGPEALPEGIILRFQSMSLERVARVEATWNAILSGVVEQNAIRDLARELHTLKGDARIVGYDEIHTLSHKLEELFALANLVGYRMSEDLEIVITMALQFIGMLLRKRASSLSGIDVPGFLRQVDEVLREARTMQIAGPRTVTTTRPAVRDTALDCLSEATRHRLAIAATGAFLEYLSARSTTSRNRLRAVWSALRDELAGLRAVALATLLERHVVAASRVATDLGKQVSIVLAVGNVHVDARVAEAIDIALVHLVRNAIDHGIEAPEVRRAAGKPEAGRITIDARVEAGMTELSVEDDGAGIDLAAVKARAIEHGLIKPERAARTTDTEMLEYLFQAGFSTRAEVTETSGRGIGLDAVKAALVRAGGAARVRSEPGLGSTITLEAPATIRQLRCYQFLAPGGNISFCVTARWDPAIEPSPGLDVLDPMTVIQLPAASRQTIHDKREPVQELALRLRWGFLDVVLKSATAPALVTAERICPTPDDYPIEIVLVDNRETILLRPEHLATATAQQPPVRASTSS